MSEPGRKVGGVEVIVGVFAGVVLEWLVIAISILLPWGSFVADTPALAGILIGVSFAGLPLLCSVLLIRRRTRLAGASLLMGVTLGSITGAGVCAGLLFAA